MLGFWPLFSVDLYLNIVEKKKFILWDPERHLAGNTPGMFLTHSHTMTPFDASGKPAF